MTRGTIVLSLFMAAASSGCARLPGHTDRASGRPELREAMSVREHLENGTNWTVPSDRHLQKVDYVSAIELAPDRAKLARLVESRGALPPRAFATDDRLALVQELLKDTEAADDARRAVLMKVGEARAKATPPSAEEVRHLHQEMLAVGKLRARLIDHLEQRFRLEARTVRKMTVEDDIEAYALQQAEPFVVDDVRLLDYEKIAEFLKAETTSALAEIDADIAAATATGAVELRIRAWTRIAGRGRSAVHVENYDDIEAWDGTKSPRVSLSLDERGQERLDRGLRLSEEMARFWNGRQRDPDALKTKLREIADRLREELEKAETDKAWFGLAEDVLKTLAKAARETAEKESDAKKKDALKRLAAILDSLPGLAKSVAEALKKRDIFAIARLLLARDGDLSKLLREIPALPAHFENLKKLVETHAAALGEAARAWIEKTIPDALAKVREFLDGNFRLLLSEFAQQVQDVPLSEAARTVDTRVRKVPIDAAGPARISLNHTPADRGDDVEVLVELVREDKPIMEASWTFRVERFGLHSRITSHLIFVDRRGEGDDPDDEEVDFAAAPSASWTLHYEFREEPSGDTLAKIWNVIDMGIGMNVSALDFEDEDFQVGVGVHLTFFSDLIQVGWGYNLNADDDAQYFFVGIGLLEALEGLGGLMGKPFAIVDRRIP